MDPKNLQPATHFNALVAATITACEAAGFVADACPPDHRGGVKVIVAKGDLDVAERLGVIQIYANANDRGGTGGRTSDVCVWRESDLPFAIDILNGIFRSGETS